MSIVLDGTNGITAANVYGRNLIINGFGRINQRGYTSGTATSGANEYTLDRWRVVTSGQSLTFTGTDAGRVMTAPAGGAEQVIEGANIAGGTYALNWTGTATATVDGNAVAKGGTFTLTANTNATVRFTSGTFSEVQVEAGTVATPFEYRSIGQELALCQRYFCKSYSLATAPGTATASGGFDVYFASASTGTLRTPVRFPVEMRAAPTVTVYDVAGASGSVFKGANGKPATVALLDSSGATIGTDDATSAAELFFHYASSAEL